MRFENIPETPVTIDAQFFETPDAGGALAFLDSVGIQAEVEEVRLPGPGRGMSKGLEVRTIFSHNRRTLRAPAPLWIAVFPTRWLELYSPKKFERKFRRKSDG